MNTSLARRHGSDAGIVVPMTLRGAGAGSITGAVISTNRVDAASTNVDTDDIGNAPITYNCPSVRSGGGTIPQNWFVKPGTYKEVSGT